MRCQHPKPELCEELGMHLYGLRYTRFMIDPGYAQRVRQNAEERKKIVASRPPGPEPGFRATPCLHELDVITWCQDLHREDRHRRGCALHGECTRSFLSHDMRACSLCRDYTAGINGFDWISEEQLVADTRRLAGILPPSINAIYGIPRSGIMPAALLAMRLHLPLYEVGYDIGIRQLQNGLRGWNSDPNGVGLIVDDSVFTGTAMKRVLTYFKGKQIKTAAVYARRGFEHKVDFYAKLVNDCHFLEWNWSNNNPIVCAPLERGNRNGVASDLDGIIVHDEESGGHPGTPYMVTRRKPIPLIVTGRPAAHRKGTEELLAYHRVLYTRLEMFPGDTLRSPGEIAAFKAAVFRESRCSVFFESEPSQAQAIHLETLLPVCCPRMGCVLQTDKQGEPDPKALENIGDRRGKVVPQNGSHVQPLLHDLSQVRS